MSRVGLQRSDPTSREPVQCFPIPTHLRMPIEASRGWWVQTVTERGQNIEKFMTFV